MEFEQCRLADNDDNAVSDREAGCHDTQAQSALTTSGGSELSSAHQFAHFVHRSLRKRIVHNFAIRVILGLANTNNAGGQYEHAGVVPASPELYVAVHLY